LFQIKPRLVPLLETTPRSSGTLLLASALRLSRNLAILGALLLIVIFTPLVASVARPLAGPWTGVDNGVLIILSGSTVTYPDPTAKLMIGLNTYWRIVHAISAWRDDHFRTILVPGYGTAESVKPLLITNVILETSIMVENKATNTRENALFSKPILEGLPGPLCAYDQRLSNVPSVALDCPSKYHS
jgi:uncharacterized SAM-binding protein YcdF (DUF218 family)